MGCSAIETLMSGSIGRISFAASLTLPGIIVAMLAKPLVLGEHVMLIGVLLALGVPIWWLKKSDERNGQVQGKDKGRAEQSATATPSNGN
jgi:hypothetical protein